jgi:hypothetical protein
MFKWTRLWTWTPQPFRLRSSKKRLLYLEGLCPWPWKTYPLHNIETPYGIHTQGVDGHTIQDHSKNCAPCHLPNLDPTIITSTWIPPLDYPCQVHQRTNNADKMLLCDNCNGGYHLFCLKPKLTQVPIGIWYYSSYSLLAPWFLLWPCHAFPDSGLGGGYMRISSQPPFVHCIYMCVHLFLVD